MENNVQDKWLIVYQGSLLDYNNDALKDSYKNKMVLVTGKKSSPNTDLVKSYLCVSDGTNNVEIPIPSLYFETIKIDGSKYAKKDNILEFAEANGIDISFDINTGAVTIGINNDTLGKIDSIDNKVEQTVYDAKVAELEASIGSKYTKPAEGIPVKDLVGEVATETEVINAISKATTELNDKIDSKVGKNDLKDLKYTVNESTSTYNGLSEATMPQIFTPTSRGVNGQILQSKGGSTPEWTDLSDIKEAIGITDDTFTKINTAIQDIESANEDYITISTKGGTTVQTKVIRAKTASIAGSENGLATAQDVRASIPETLPNPNALEISLNGLPVKTYDGSSTYKLSFYAPTKVGSKGQVFKSIDGIMVDWGNVDWSEIKNKPDVINFANDLTGVLEATPEEFTFRPSAGDQSIRDESAVIRRIKGNTTVWNQHLQNNGISAGDKYVDIVQDDTEWTGNLQNMDSSCDNPWKFGIRVPTLRKTVGHKYLLVMDAMVSRIASSYYNDIFSLAWGNELFDVNVQMNEPSKWQSLSCIFSPNIASEDTYSLIRPPWCFTYSLGGKNGDYYKVKKAQLFDLTSIFGAGNEPTTLVEFKKIYSESYYPYCVPEIRNVKTTAIETVGFNQWDEQWENGSFDIATGENIISTQIRCKNLIRVLPNTHYSLSIGNIYMGIWAMFYDENNSILEPVNINSSVAGKCLYVSPSDNRNIFVTPANAAWMKFYLTAEYGTSYNNDICINLSHSGVRNGEYHPYKRSIFELPEVLNYFPEGMNGIGDVYDEINAENAIQRIGVVDIGTLEWYAGAQKNMFLAPIENAKPTVWNEITNAIMLPYTAVSRIESGTADMSFCVNNMAHYPNRVCLTNFNYEDAASFKAAMSGVYLYYELEKPEIRPILDPIQLSYDVEDFGTERVISRKGSSPFRADIVYQFNAEGRIRDNGRNIAKLETKVDTLDRAITVANGRFDGGYVKAEGIIDAAENLYLLPSSSSTEKDKRLANEQYVIDSLPREVAQAVERIVGSSIPQQLSPNIIYEATGSILNLTIVSLNGQEDSYDDVWRIRCGLDGNATIDILPTRVLWENGIAPNPTEWGIYEFEFRKTQSLDNRILGRWRVYK